MRSITDITNTIINGDSLEVLRTFPDSCIDCVITSPPYWQLRDYGWKNQWGLEKTYKEYLEKLWKLMDEIHRLLKPEGTVWINLGDTYFGSGNGSGKKEGETARSIANYKNGEVYPSVANVSKENGLPKKTLSLIPHRFAIGCIERGWIIRNDIIWAKPNSLPEGIKDRFGKKHEHIFFLTKSPNYYFNLDAIRDPHKNSSKARSKYQVTAFGGDDNNSKGALGKGVKSGAQAKKIELNPLGKNPGDVTDFWVISTKHNREKHYAVFNCELIQKPVLAGCPQNGIILDPFCGTGTTGVCAIGSGRNFIGIDGSEEYCTIARRKIKEVMEDKPTHTLEGKLTSQEVAGKLNEQADVLQKYIDAKMNPAISRQNPTARRMRIANSMREEALEMQRMQTILRALAKAHQTNRILHYPHLEDIRNKKQIESLLTLEKIEKYNWDLHRYIEMDQETLKRMSIFSAHDWKNAYGQLEDLLAEFSGGDETPKMQRENDSKIRNLEMEVISRKIPGFFPTPLDLIERMIDMADIQKGDSVVDPSAGKGDILDEVEKKFNGDVSTGAFEINSTLREILLLKGHEIYGNDFFYFKGENFDKILMNPPFEKGADVDHVLHAYSVLNPGGRIVAIMSEGVFFRSLKKEKDFRQWLHKQNALISEPIKEAFKNSFKSTRITVRLVMIDKPAEHTKNMKESELNEMELLELEAKAELELLRMELESDTTSVEGMIKPYAPIQESNMTIEDKKLKTVPEIMLSYKRDTDHPKLKITSSKDAADFLRPLFDENTIEMKEQFIVLYLNRASNIIGYHHLSTGGLAGTVADTRLIFSSALKCLATGIILCHNHPSGNLKPSEADIKITRRCNEVGRLHEINLLDHIIITKDSFFSFTDEGLN